MQTSDGQLIKSEQMHIGSHDKSVSCQEQAALQAIVSYVCQVIKIFIAVFSCRKYVL